MPEPVIHWPPRSRTRHDISKTALVSVVKLVSFFVPLFIAKDEETTQAAPTLAGIEDLVSIKCLLDPFTCLRQMSFRVGVMPIS